MSLKSVKRAVVTGMWWEVTWTGGPSECPQTVIVTVAADTAEAAEALSVHYVHDEMTQLFCLQVRPAPGPHRGGHGQPSGPAPGPGPKKDGNA